MAIPITKTEGYVGNDALFQARVVAPDGSGTVVKYEGNALTPSDVSTISCSVYDLNSSTPGTAVATPTVTVSAISSTLVIDDNWTELHNYKDSTGRNFRHQVSGSVFATASHVYRVVYTLVTVGGTSVKWEHEHAAIGAVPS